MSTNIAGGDGPGAKTRRQLSELQVRQIELQMQNEELVRSRAEIERGLAQFTDLFDRAPVGYFTLDRNGLIRRANRTGAELLGVDPASLANRQFVQFVVPDARPKFAAFLEAVFEKRTYRRWEAPLLRAGGRPRFVRFVATAPPSGRECQVAALDISDRRRMEQALRKSEEKYRLIAENAVEMIWTADSSLKMQYVSPAVTRLRGYSVEEALGQGASQIFPAPSLKMLNRFLADGQKKHGAASVAAGGLPPIELEQRCKDGSTVWTECQFAFLQHGDGLPPGIICVARDITERRRQQAENLTTEARLRHQQKLESIGTVASGVAHEINNPLMGIMNFAELMQAQDLPPAKVRAFAGKIVAESARAARIVRNLLAFSRQDSEEHGPVQIDAVIDETLSLTTAALRNDKIRLTVEVEPGLPALHCRSQQIQQVILNLVNNARDALNERYPRRDPGKTLSIRAERFEKEGRPWIRTIVEDGGVGIAPQTISRIFDPFFSTKPRYLSTGLGLSVSHGIVREHGGDLWVESKLGEFSRFGVDLPVDDGRRPDRQGTA